MKAIWRSKKTPPAAQYAVEDDKSLEQLKSLLEEALEARMGGPSGAVMQKIHDASVAAAGKRRLPAPSPWWRPAAAALLIAAALSPVFFLVRNTHEARQSVPTEIGPYQAVANILCLLTVDTEDQLWEVSSLDPGSERRQLSDWLLEYQGFSETPEIILSPADHGQGETRWHSIPWSWDRTHV